MGEDKNSAGNGSGTTIFEARRHCRCIPAVVDLEVVMMDAIEGRGEHPQQAVRFIVNLKHTP